MSVKKKFQEVDRSKRRRPGHLFRDAAEDRLYAQHTEAPSSAEQQINSPSYRLAFDDIDYLLADEQRPLRLQLELAKPEAVMNAHGIEHTVASAQWVSNVLATQSAALCWRSWRE